MRFHDTLPSTDESASCEADMHALVRLLRQDTKVGDLDDPETLVANLRRDDAAGEKAATRIAVVLKRLGSSSYGIAIKIITDIGSATVKKMLGL